MTERIKEKEIVVCIGELLLAELTCFYINDLKQKNGLAANISPN